MPDTPGPAYGDLETDFPMPGADSALNPTLFYEDAPEHLRSLSGEGEAKVRYRVLPGGEAGTLSIEVLDFQPEIKPEPEQEPEEDAAGAMTRFMERSSPPAPTSY